ncbi:regulatory signaling modulator protein AmpE [Alishewanella sp. d11]|uniref:regulatory signaling modulator protein AmpE n=1 Tax=Alishewanella sp. d11 TaxID=3414030 RepID=UPI003BF82530
MTLISMLLALIIERLAVRSDAWQARPYCQAYLNLTARSGMSKLAEHPLGRYLWIMLPGLLVALCLLLLDSRLITLIVNTLVLLVGIGCWHYRQLYKQYLNALDRSDDEAAYLAMQQIRTDSRSTVDDSNGLLLVWLNFRYYAAVVFWFLLLGVFGVITYALLRHLNEQTALTAETATAQADPLAQSTAAEAIIIDEAEVAIIVETEIVEDIATSSDAAATAAPVAGQSKDAVHYLLHWADFFPARLFGLGFALVGYFSRASNALLGYFLDVTANNQQVVTDVAKAAEPILESPQQNSDDTSAMVQLAKRNMLFFLAFTAILTLSGWLS